MTSGALLVLIPAVLLCAALVSLIPLGRRLAPVATIVAAVAALLLAGLSASRVLAFGKIVALPHWIGIDGFGALLLLLITFVGTLAALFSPGYMRVRARERSDGALRAYHANFNLFLFSIVTVPMMQEVALAWIAVELTTILSVLLVSFEGTSEALEAAWKYVILTMIGAGIALLGVIILYGALQQSVGGPFTWSALRRAGGDLPPTLLEGGFLLVLVGFGVKVGLVPMHTWLPDAHSQAPSPVCALLSGVETSTILYLILRLFPVAEAQPLIHVQDWAIVFGLISVGTASLLLIQVRDLKRLFAFSTVEQMGIILTAAGFGVAANPSIAPYQIFTHGLAKSLCFLAAGSVLVVAGTREIASLRGLIRSEPIAGAALLVGALAVTGAPPFALFLSELSIIRAGLAAHNYIAVALLVLFIVIAFAAILFHINRVVFGDPGGAHGARVGRGRIPRASLLALLLAMIPALLFGVWIPAPLHALISMAGATIGGPIP